MPPNPSHGAMSFSLPSDLTRYLSEIDKFIDTTIAPLQASNDNERFFDHRREHARTDWDNQGLPRDDWESLLAQARKLADDAACLKNSVGRMAGIYGWP
jgi:acyl-CoA dehydrogenase